MLFSLELAFFFFNWTYLTVACSYLKTPRLFLNYCNDQATNFLILCKLIAAYNATGDIGTASSPPPKESWKWFIRQPYFAVILFSFTLLEGGHCAWSCFFYYINASCILLHLAHKGFMRVFFLLFVEIKHIK